jgi:hypothetical protein
MSPLVDIIFPFKNCPCEGGLLRVIVFRGW